MNRNQAQLQREAVMASRIRSRLDGAAGEWAAQTADVNLVGLAAFAQRAREAGVDVSDWDAVHMAMHQWSVPDVVHVPEVLDVMALSIQDIGDDPLMVLREAVRSFRSGNGAA